MDGFAGRVFEAGQIGRIPPQKFAPKILTWINALPGKISVLISPGTALI
jgi:hypothetical protein